MAGEKFDGRRELMHRSAMLDAHGANDRLCLARSILDDKFDKPRRARGMGGVQSGLASCTKRAETPDNKVTETNAAQDEDTGRTGAAEPGRKKSTVERKALRQYTDKRTASMVAEAQNSAPAKQNCFTKCCESKKAEVVAQPHRRSIHGRAVTVYHD